MTAWLMAPRKNVRAERVTSDRVQRAGATLCRVSNFEIGSKHENIAKALKARLSELTNRVVEIDSELRKPLSADLEEQATDLENQGALEAIEDSEIHEIHKI